MSERFFRSIIEATGTKVSKSDTEQLRQLQAEWKNAHDAVNSHTYIQARQAWEAHQKMLQQSIRTGEFSKTPGRTLEDFYRDFEAKLTAARLEMNRCCREAIPLASAVCEKLCADVNDLASEIEKREGAEHAKFEVAYVPSALLTNLREAPFQLRRRIPTGNQYAAHSIASMVPYLDL